MPIYGRRLPMYGRRFAYLRETKNPKNGLYLCVITRVFQASGSLDSIRHIRQQQTERGVLLLKSN